MVQKVNKWQAEPTLHTPHSTLHTPHSTLHTPHSTLLSVIIVFAIIFLIIGACSNPFYPVASPGGGGGPGSSSVTIDGLRAYILNLPDNPPPAEPHTVKLASVNISDVWGTINSEIRTAIAEGAGNKFVVLDLSDCYATDNTVTTSGQVPPSGNDMNIIMDTPNIKGIVLPSGLESIGDMAFLSCRNLTSITIPDSVTSIGSWVFQYCSSLTSITIHLGVASIGTSTFSGCSGLTSIAIPDSVTSIGINAFWDCIGLTSIAIPSNVTSIGNRAFYGCVNLTSVTFESGSNIASADFATGAFPPGNDLVTKYLTGGGAGTYTRSPGGSTWTKL